MFVLCRLLEEEPVEAATRATLLKQAVEDCFIGRHLTFGIKVQSTSTTGNSTSILLDNLTAHPGNAVILSYLLCGIRYSHIGYHK